MIKQKKMLIEAENKAEQLFNLIEEKNLIVEGKSESQLCDEISKLALDKFNVKNFWHKKIVRSGKNTLLPYKENPQDLKFEKDDIIFIDFGPVFGNWEADYGKTYVLGNNKRKLKLKNDIESAWKEGNEFFKNNKNQLTGADFYYFTEKLAKKYGWEYGNSHCGHLIGSFPHEKLIGEEKINYIHPKNSKLMCEKDKNGNDRFWIYEIHFIDKKNEIGGFLEKLLY